MNVFRTYTNKYKSIVLLVLILLTSNTMDAQTIYDKNGAMFTYRIKGDDWQSHPLREVVSTVPLYEFRPITPIHHIMGSVKSAPSNPYFVISDVIES